MQQIAGDKARIARFQFHSADSGFIAACDASVCTCDTTEPVPDTAGWGLLQPSMTSRAATKPTNNPGRFNIVFII